MLDKGERRAPATPNKAMIDGKGSEKMRTDENLYRFKYKSKGEK